MGLERPSWVIWGGSLCLGGPSWVTGGGIVGSGGTWLSPGGLGGCGRVIWGGSLGTRLGPRGSWWTLLSHWGGVHWILGDPVRVCGLLGTWLGSLVGLGGPWPCPAPPPRSVPHLCPGTGSCHHPGAPGPRGSRWRHRWGRPPGTVLGGVRGPSPPRPHVPVTPSPRPRHPPTPPQPQGPPASPACPPTSPEVPGRRCPPRPPPYAPLAV